MMSRVDPQHSQPHAPDKHQQMTPADLASHIEEDHYPFPSEIMADWYFPHVVDQVLTERGIPHATGPTGEGGRYVEAWELDGLTAWHTLAHETIDHRLAPESIAFHRDKRAKALGIDPSAYLVTAVAFGDYDPMRHGKERKGVRVDLGTVRRYSQSHWPMACLACPEPLTTPATRAAGAARLLEHHEAAHPRKQASALGP
jgi:hypothetical protein